jgi:TRAP-type C4-dicarboxylate transport system permease small subunit
LGPPRLPTSPAREYSKNIPPASCKQSGIGYTFASVPRSLGPGKHFPRKGATINTTASVDSTESAFETRSLVDRILGGLDRILQILCVILLGAVVLAVSAQVLSRYVTSSSTPWTVELASYSFVWLSMIAIALGVRRGRHMVLDIWEYVPYKRWLMRILETITAAIIVTVLAALVWYGFEALPPSFRRNSPGLGISFGWVALAVPVGAAFSLLFAIEAWWKLFHAPQGVDPLTAPVLYQPDDVIIIKGEV